MELIKEELGEKYTLLFVLIVMRSYDKEGCYRVFDQQGIEPIIPPQKNGVLHEQENWMRPRNNAIKEIAGLGDNQDARQL